MADKNLVNEFYRAKASQVPLDAVEVVGAEQYEFNRKVYIRMSRAGATFKLDRAAKISFYDELVNFNSARIEEHKQRRRMFAQSEYAEDGLLAETEAKVF